MMESELEIVPADRRPARGLRALRLFRRRTDGSVAVEFAMLSVPFLSLIFAIFQTSMVHITGQVLQTAVTDASRLIMTGQAQNAAMTKDQFKTEICKRVTALFNCNSLLQLDVQTPTGGWAAATIAAPPVVGGVIDSTQLNTFDLGTQGSIVVVRAMIAYPIIVPLVGQSFINLSGNKLLIMASAAFQNEPYS